ncbi:MAG: DNA alkylation repair protein [Lentisphaerae bacterium]|nr:DNA alkylation repair protein [Lentisphaerota bacterium]
MSVSGEMKLALRKAASPADAVQLARFFKTGRGEYGEGDRFLGIRVPALRAVVRRFTSDAAVGDGLCLLRSPWHEERLCGLLVWVALFEREDAGCRRRIYTAYLANADRVNNWDLVDLSAPNIVGEWLLARPTNTLDRLARSRCLWERRIAIVATFAFIRRGRFGETLRIAEALLADREDLIHKAAGWMLREAGKRDESALRGFLDRHAPRMPRTMLRYAIERLPDRDRRRYMAVPRVASPAVRPGARRRS